MKATGIIRRIDDLGRVFIPKEICRTLNIKEGDPLEIYIDNDGGIILRKYQTEVESISDKCAKIVATAVKNGYLFGMFVDGNEVTIITPKGKATARCHPKDKFNLNVGVTVALSKLNYIKIPDGLSD